MYFGKCVCGTRFCSFVVHVFHNRMGVVICVCEVRVRVSDVIVSNELATNLVKCLLLALVLRMQISQQGKSSVLRSCLPFAILYFTKVE